MCMVCSTIVRLWSSAVDGAQRARNITECRADAPKLSHSEMSFTSFHIRTPRNHASRHRWSDESRKRVQRMAPGFGTSREERYRERAWTSPIVPLDVAVTKGFSYVAFGS